MHPYTHDTYRPTEDEEYMCRNHRLYFKDRLLAWRRNLVAISEVLRGGLRDNAVKAADPLDQSVLQTEVYLDLTTTERQNRLLREIDLALGRIEAGLYGYCEITEEEIGLKRLEAQPLATRCIEAQKEFEQAENARRRPAAARESGSSPDALRELFLTL